MREENSGLWYDAMKEEIESMAKNQVWELVELPKGASIVGYKLVFKTNETHLEISNDIKLYLSLRVVLKRKVLITY